MLMIALSLVLLAVPEPLFCDQVLAVAPQVYDAELADALGNHDHYLDAAEAEIAAALEAMPEATSCALGVSVPMDVPTTSDVVSFSLTRACGLVCDVAETHASVVLPAIDASCLLYGGRDWQGQAPCEFGCKVGSMLEKGPSGTWTVRAAVVEGNIEPVTPPGPKPLNVPPLVRYKPACSRRQRPWRRSGRGGSRPASARSSASAPMPTSIAGQTRASSRRCHGSRLALGRWPMSSSVQALSASQPPPRSPPRCSNSTPPDRVVHPRPGLGPAKGAQSQRRPGTPGPCPDVLRTLPAGGHSLERSASSVIALNMDLVPGTSSPACSNPSHDSRAPSQPHISTRLPRISTCLPRISTRLPRISTHMPLISTRLPCIFRCLPRTFRCLPRISTRLPRIFPCQPRIFPCHPRISRHLPRIGGRPPRI